MADEISWNYLTLASVALYICTYSILPSLTAAMSQVCVTVFGTLCRKSGGGLGGKKGQKRSVLLVSFCFILFYRQEFGNLVRWWTLIRSLPNRLVDRNGEKGGLNTGQIPTETGGYLSSHNRS